MSARSIFRFFQGGQLSSNVAILLSGGWYRSIFCGCLSFHTRC